MGRPGSGCWRASGQSPCVDEDDDDGAAALQPGDRFFAPWRVSRVDPGDETVLVRMEDEQGGTVTLGIGTREDHSGPFDLSPFWIHYRDENVPFEAFERAARTLGELLAATLPDGVGGIRRWLDQLTASAGQRRQSGARVNLLVTKDTIVSAQAWCERQLEAGARAVELAVSDRAAPPLGALRELVRQLARRFANTGLRLHWRSQRGAPLCVFPGELGEVLLSEPGRIRVPEGTALGSYAAACQSCALRVACPGVAEAALQRGDADALTPFDAEGEALPHRYHWADGVRWLLVDQPGRRVRLGDVVPEHALPGTPCHLPWTQLQCNADGGFSPCSPENPSERSPRRTVDDDIGTLWNSDYLRTFRRALRDEVSPSSCSPTCPVLRDGSRSPEEHVLWGGSEVFVRAQIEAVDALLHEEEVLAGAPPTLQLSATSYCNYDCVMCRCGEVGDREDEPSEAFYEDLRDRLGRITTVQLTGGEPLASPRLRRFLSEVDERDFPDLRIAVMTNGSYFTADNLASWRETPFADIVVGLNAAHPDTYERVNRGLAWADIRERLDALLSWRDAWRPATTIAYGMLVVRQNVEDLRDFAGLAQADGVPARFGLSRRNRNDSNVRFDELAKGRAIEALRELARGYDDAAAHGTKRRLEALAASLEDPRQGLD